MLRSTRILPSKSALKVPLAALLIPKSPGFAVPTPIVPNPVTTNDSAPVLTCKFCFGKVVPIPTRPSSVIMKTDLNGSTGSLGSNVNPPTAT